MIIRYSATALTTTFTTKTSSRPLIDRPLTLDVVYDLPTFPRRQSTIPKLAKTGIAFDTNSISFPHAELHAGYTRRFHIDVPLSNSVPIYHHRYPTNPSFESSDALTGIYESCRHCHHVETLPIPFPSSVSSLLLTALSRRTHVFGASITLACGVPGICSWCRNGARKNCKGSVVPVFYTRTVLYV